MRMNFVSDKKKTATKPPKNFAKESFHPLSYTCPYLFSFAQNYSNPLMSILFLTAESATYSLANPKNDPTFLPMFRCKSQPWTAHV